jgi:flagellar basal body-associated protein FliL
MKKMSWTRCSEGVVVGVLVVVVLAAAGTGAALSFDDENVPAEAEVRSEQTYSVTVTELFSAENTDLPDQWTLQATTEFDDAEISITSQDVADNTVNQTSVENDEATLTVRQADGINRVVVEVSGRVPAVDTYSYADRSVENFSVLEFTRVQDGSEFTLADGEAEWNVHRFTTDSKNARQAIDSANDAIDSSTDSDAQDRLDEAISFYDNGEFGNAVTAAEDAESTATSDSNLSQILLIVGGVVVVVAVLGGGVYLWQSRQQDTSKLQ